MADEVTSLSPAEERQFRSWAMANGITDVDQPDSHYDYRGYWKATNGADHSPGTVQHFPDTFKQHGHQTFSQESQYSRGAFDGGMWIGDRFIAQPKLTVMHDAMLNDAIKSLLSKP